MMEIPFSLSRKKNSLKDLFSRNFKQYLSHGLVVSLPPGNSSLFHSSCGTTQLLIIFTSNKLLLSFSVLVTFYSALVFPLLSRYFNRFGFCLPSPLCNLCFVLFPLSWAHLQASAPLLGFWLPWSKIPQGNLGIWVNPIPDLIVFVPLDGS